MLIEWTKRLWFKGHHNAFTDLCSFNNQLLCCFREAGNHVSPDGKIRILTLNKNGVVISNCLLQQTNVDMRDPKLSVMPDGNLLLIGYCRYTDKNQNWLYSKPCSWVSQDGKSWSTKQDLGQKNWWLWRVTWFQKDAFGFAYNRNRNAIHLYKGNPRRTFHTLKENVLSLQTHGLGYPNESDMAFTKDGTSYAIVRRDADTFSAQLGSSKPPYKYWNWRDLGDYIGGPTMHLLNDKTALVAGRTFCNGKAKTAIWSLCLEKAILQPELILPSSGDTSYPGLIIEGDVAYLSYYSCHIDQKSSIYLAKLAL